jgi:hypothetical protein
MMMKIKREEAHREEEVVEIEYTSQCLVIMILTILIQDINVAEMILKWTDLHQWETDNAEEEAWDPHLNSTMTIIEDLLKDTTTIPTFNLDIIIRTMIAECLKWEVHQWEDQEMHHMVAQDKVHQEILEMKLTETQEMIQEEILEEIQEEILEVI